MFRVCKINLMMTAAKSFVLRFGAGLVFIGAAILGMWSWHFDSVQQQGAEREALLNGPVQYLVIAPFFFLVGLELKREFINGALKPLRNAVSPALAAVFGVALPAAWYLALTWHTDASAGWPIPTATDVTFALVFYSAFGRWMPRGARVFLLSFAVLDDLIAVALITAVFGLHGAVGAAEIIPVLLAFVTPMRWPSRIERPLAFYLNWFGLPWFAFLICQTQIQPWGVTAASVVFWAVVARPVWKWLGVFTGGWIGRRWATGELRLTARTLVAVSSLGGVGFTVSFLVTQLAFGNQPDAKSAAITATFVASGVTVVFAALAMLGLAKQKASSRS
jgi:Na+:H+ antiporter, NhaA family